MYAAWRLLCLDFYLLVNVVRRMLLTTQRSAIVIVGIALICLIAATYSSFYVMITGGRRPAPAPNQRLTAIIFRYVYGE